MENFCTSAACCKPLGFSLNIISLLVGVVTFVSGCLLWKPSMDFDMVILHLFMMASGLFIIVFELFYVPSIGMYIKCYQTLWGRVIYWTVMAFMAWMNGDDAHKVLFSLILCAVGFLVIYGLVAQFLLQVPFGIPPPLIGFPKPPKAKHLPAASSVDVESGGTAETAYSLR